MGKRRKQAGLAVRMKRGAYIPVVVRTKHETITVRIGRGHDGRTIIDAPRCCDIILPERRK